MTATAAIEQLLYRPATLRDVSAMAQLRSEHWGNAPDWEHTVSAYLSGEHHPRQALLPRIAIVAEEEDEIVGFIAGHLTRRHRCDGELQWINVPASQRGNAMASELLQNLAEWFVENGARRVCVDVQPRNTIARAFYTRHGAEPLNDRWMLFPDISVVASQR